MIEGFKAYEKHFKKFETSEAAVKEGKAIDFNSNAGYTHVCDIKFDGKMSRLLSFDGFEGSYVITSALSRQLQVELVQHCLSDCLQPENKTNLHGHTESAVISSQLLNLWATESVLIDSLIGDPCPKLPKSTMLSKIRWVTLGYQYDWTARKYVHDQFVPFPSKLAALCSEIGDLIGNEVGAGYTMKPDAAIVNFYPEGAVMGGHIDDAERTYDHPVISISIGCPCIFLLGGFDKDSNPIPMVLRSGDILIMGGKSRLRVHAVPKVFTKELPPLFLHPDTAGRDKIHLVNCSKFLHRRGSNRCERNSCKDDGNNHRGGGSGSSSSGSDSSSGRSKGSCGDRGSGSSSYSGSGSGSGNVSSSGCDNSSGSSSGSSSGHDSGNNDSIRVEKMDSSNLKRSVQDECESGNTNMNSSPSSSSASVSVCSSIVHKKQKSLNRSEYEALVKVTSIEEKRDTEMRVTDEACVVRDFSDVSAETECTCKKLSIDEERRALRFLQTTRININVRQVYSDLNKMITQ